MVESQSHGYQRMQRKGVAMARIAPTDHVTTIAGTKGHGVRGVYVGVFLSNVLEAVDEVIVWATAPIPGDGVGQGLAVVLEAV